MRVNEEEQVTILLYSMFGSWDNLIFGHEIVAPTIRASLQVRVREFSGIKGALDVQINCMS